VDYKKHKENLFLSCLIVWIAISIGELTSPMLNWVDCKKLRRTYFSHA